MAAPELDDSADLVRGRGGPDLQEDILDSQQTMGLEGELAAQTEERQTEQLDVLEGLRQLQTADPIVWKVYRYGHDDQKYNGYLGQLQTTSLTQENLRKKFGGGQYRIRGTFPGGRYATQRQLTIAGESILYVPTEVNGASPPVSTPMPAFNMSEFMAVQQQLDEKREVVAERRRQEEEARAERRSKETRDFIVAIGAVAAPIITALVQKPAPAASTVVATQSESPVSQMKGLLEMMTMMKTIMVPESSGGSELAEIINAVTPIAGPALQAFANRPQPAPRPRATRPPDPTQQPTGVPTGVGAINKRPPPVTIEATPVAEQRPVTAPAQPVPGETPTRMQASGPSIHSGADMSAPTQLMNAQESSMFAQLKPQVDALVQMARDGQDPAAVAELFYDQFMSSADDDLYGRLADLFEDPKTIGRMALFNKGVTEFAPFFTVLQETIVKRINQEEAQATVQNTEGVDTPA